MRRARVLLSLGMLAGCALNSLVLGGATPVFAAARSHAPEVHARPAAPPKGLPDLGADVAPVEPLAALGTGDETAVGLATQPVGICL